MRNEKLISLLLEERAKLTQKIEAVQALLKAYDTVIEDCKSEPRLDMQHFDNPDLDKHKLGYGHTLPFILDVLKDNSRALTANEILEAIENKGYTTTLNNLVSQLYNFEKKGKINSSKDSKSKRVYSVAKSSMKVA